MKERDEMTVGPKSKAHVNESSETDMSASSFSKVIYNQTVIHSSHTLEDLFTSHIDIKSLQDKINHQFNDLGLLIRSLTHSSFAHEYSQSQLKSYERLEFLGDSVVGTFVTNKLFQNFDHYQEGKLSKLKSALVNEGTLSDLAKFLGLSHLILRGKGELKDEVNESILCDVFEAIVGAVFVDENILKAFTVLETVIKQYERHTGVKFFCESKLALFDPKTTLQEITMKKYQKLPKYKFEKIGEKFQVDLWINGNKYESVTHISKKHAMKEVALKYLVNNKLITSNEVEESSC